MDYYLASSAIALLGGIVASVCWVVLWLKTGHGAGWAVLGVVPFVTQMMPSVLMAVGLVPVEAFVGLNILGSLVFMAYMLVFTFKRWPIQNWKSQEVFE